jgi:hypothetical protein
MASMFFNTRHFSQPLTFDTGSVTDMSSMFGQADAYHNIG